MDICTHANIQGRCAPQRFFFFPLQQNMCITFSVVNTLRPRQNGYHFPGNIFQMHFLNENVWIPTKISLKFVSKGPIKFGADQAIRHYLNQLERLRSEDTPRRPMITHTIDQFILNPKSILLTSSYRIPSQNNVKAEKLEKFANNLNFTILL